jgi:DNA polymerase alpha subunit A
MSAKDMLPKEADYTLPHLTKKQLNEDLEEFDHNMLSELLQTSPKALQVIRHTEKEALSALKIMHKLAVLPLTKQLANIAGHLWIRSLQNARAERNEMLLMHKFHDRKYIIPDKVISPAKKKSAGENMLDDGEEEKVAKKTRKKAAYEGGLVLEPKSGFYDRFVLLLDFQSLYPSIIQEFNICFTTVKRSSSQKLPNKGGNAIESTVDEIGKLPPREVKRGILPGILEELVRQRRNVKKQLNDTKDPLMKQQYDIQQRALKLSANSMYGCLGFTNSRFYAKPIAALITKKGRDTLQSAYNVASKELNLQVIYGDTDSLMINSNKDSLQEALEIANNLKQAINKTYEKLEIEIDGVFKCLLLLKKKKYAALKLKNPYSDKDGTAIDIKGLDMVRRDWCKLTKILSDEVLKELMSGKNSEEVTVAINKKFADYGQRLQHGKIRLSEFIITKQLTKSLSEYKDAQRQPHVRVAQWLIRKGENESNLIGHFIPYVICKGDQGLPFADRAHHPSEVQDKNLAIDTTWYATQQILPPLQRLLEHLKEFNLDDLPIQFGLDPKEHRIVRHQ